MDSALTFLGAAQTVTGSRFLLQSGRRQYLVDCGLFQGRHLEERNWQPFPIHPQSLDAIILTHAHLDHTGYLPRLVRQGYSGPIYASEATCALLKILLPDAAHLEEQDAAYANKKGYSRHKPALPLYTAVDAQRALELLRPVSFPQQLTLDGLTVSWERAGHILGSGIVEIDLGQGDGQRRLIFSGDLGRYGQEMMKSPQVMEKADYLLVESTYGNRLHSAESIADALQRVIAQVIEKGGMLLIPAFAVGRTQQLLFHIRRLQDESRVPDLPVYIDSPMAVDVTDLYCQFGDDHNLNVDLLMDEESCPLRCKNTKFVRDVEDSKALNTRPGPAIIISASGMCTGGRILHHLKWRLPDPKNMVLFVGFQAEGTRGRLLRDGAEEITIHGDRIPVRAEITAVDALSSHGDQKEILRWLSGFRRLPRATFIVHGEPPASQSLQEKIQGELGWPATRPELGSKFSLD